ncbi:hypothetical protein ACGFMK_07800 [Amycolatopsis sp. NPDC049252]|uniref:hypothetical protein n=1 Tax=Amycolatopsis sp. NPDC049252 TaxID=3363933 RepID=UPI003716C630
MDAMQPEVNVDFNEIVRELNELRRGRGIFATDIAQRTGRLLRQFCEIQSTEPDRQVREKLIQAITSLTTTLPDDLQLAALTALGLEENAPEESLEQRLSWLAEALGREPRTARRRVDLAFRTMAEEIVARMNSPSAGYTAEQWHTESVRGIFRLDLESPTLTETRQIVSMTDGLEEIQLPATAPRRTPSQKDHVHAEFIYGGRILGRKQVSPSHMVLSVELAKPLQLGERYEYCIQYTMLSPELMHPYYFLTPLRRTNFFSARVKFAPDRLPGNLWAVTGVPPRAAEEINSEDVPVTIDRIGEAAVDFHALKQGLTYGLRWSE